MTLIELYKSYGKDGAKGEGARALLAQTHWFTIHAEFDPKTGNALPQALSAFLAKVANAELHGIVQDRLYRITEHARPAVERLFRALNESPRREHALLPIRAVRELDAGSFIKLSTRPGRNIREKLASKPYVQAVRRFQSINLPENRLLKAYVSHLSELLELRRDYLGEKEDKLSPKIKYWLHSEEAKAICGWDNLPPNNTLLSHRDYRRVWDAWRWLQTIDDDIARDLSRLNFRGDTMRRWTDYGRMYRDGKHRLAEMPVLFDYDKFTIRTWTPELLVQKAARRIVRSCGERVIARPVCVDLAQLHPRFAVTATSDEELTENYVWQQWKNDTESVDIALFNSDAAYIHPNATTIASPGLFFLSDKSNDRLDRAARAFAARLSATFVNDKLIWLYPDFLNDFDLEIVRRNLNARFRCAQPLPRSIAAVFEKADYNRITNDGYPIVVVDTLGEKTCVTKLLARFDQDLKKCLPETNGFYWERCPPVVLPRQDAEQAAGKEQPFEMITVDGNGLWGDSSQQPKRLQPIDPHTIKSDPRIGQFAFCINVTKSPVIGGMRLHALQERAGVIPLWRDQIPELSIKVMKDGRYQRFHLVSQGTTTVTPIRGVSVQIPVVERFKLPAGKSFYQFPLFQGEKANERPHADHHPPSRGALGFSARLDSPAFPVKHDTDCKLNLTFEYGADEPYTLIFAPLDKSFPPVRATWRRTEEIVINDAPAPGYPRPVSWADLRKVPKPDGKETSDLLEWVLSAIDRLKTRPQKRTIGRIKTSWFEKNGNHFSFAECDETETDVILHENNFVKGLDYENFHMGAKVSFELQERNRKFAGYKIAAPDYRDENDQATTDLVKTIRKRLYVPFIKVWGDGRSISDEKCPEYFANAARNRIECLNGLLKDVGISQRIRSEILFLLACLHKDTTDDCVQWLTEQVESGNIRDARAVGFALGDVSKGWQQYIFNRLASNSNIHTISVFNCAIWREQHFVERFSIFELQAILNALSQRLKKIILKLDRERDISHGINRDWVRSTAETLELLLGLLRTRASADSDIKMLLQPHQKITKELAKQVERVTEIVEQSNITLFSRVQLNIQKPDGDRTPDLLYALRLYLTGEDGANAIHITGISENDND